jgi:choline dehydrogenase-like flavoprotein
MIVDARRVEAGAEIEADLCIVGAGPAGIALALELAGGSARVVVLESGGLSYDLAAQALNEGELAGVPYFPLQATRLRALGGTTNHWGGLARVFEERDFERRSWVPRSGWPIGNDDLEPFWPRAARFLRLPTDDFGLDEWRERSPREPLPLWGAVETRTTQVVAPEHLRVGVTHREALERARSVTTYLHATVTELETDEAGGAVTRAHVRVLEGGEFSLSARHFVLAAGGIENPRLLLASDRRHARGLGNQDDLVGRFFMEHPRFRAATIVPTDAQLPVGFYDEHETGTGRVLGYLVLSDDVKRREEIVDVQIRLQPEYVESYDRALASRSVRSARALRAMPRRAAELDEFARDVARVASDVTTWRRFTVPGSPLPLPHPDVAGRLARASKVDRASLLPALLGDVAAAGYAAVSQRPPLRGIALRTRIESVPNPDSRVTLVRDRDALGMRRVRLDWRLHELDIRSAVRAVEILGAELGRTGLGRLRLDVDPEATEPPPDIAGGWHHMGTTRMSDDPRQGVVDRNCRVHGISNLYVAGSSVFVTPGSGTPTLALLALALRLSDHLKGRLA